MKRLLKAIAAIPAGALSAILISIVMTLEAVFDIWDAIDHVGWYRCVLAMLMLPAMVALFGYFIIRAAIVVIADPDPNGTTPNNLNDPADW